MTIEELIGQVIMVGLSGYSLDDDSKKLIEKYTRQTKSQYFESI